VAQAREVILLGYCMGLIQGCDWVGGHILEVDCLLPHPDTVTRNKNT
jgi:hypothetical protein